MGSRGRQRPIASRSAAAAAAAAVAAARQVPAQQEAGDQAGCARGRKRVHHILLYLADLRRGGGKEGHVCSRRLHACARATLAHTPTYSTQLRAFMLMGDLSPSTKGSMKGVISGSMVAASSCTGTLSSTTAGGARGGGGGGARDRLDNAQATNDDETAGQVPQLPRWWAAGGAQPHC